MKSQFKIVVFFTLLVASLQANASISFNYNCRKAYENVTGLRFNQAKEYIALEKRQNPENKAILLAENYMDCMEIILSENKTLLKAKLPQKEVRLKAIGKESENSPYFNYIQAEINMQWAFAHIKTNEYWSGVMAINKAYKLLQRNIKKYPNFKPQLKSIGLLHALIGVVPDEYKWAVKLLGFDGSLNQGVSELNQIYMASKSDSLLACFNTESTLMLGIIRINFSPDEPSLNQVLRDIASKAIGNPILSFVYADICIHAGKNDEAIAYLLNHRYFDNVHYPFHYLNYMLGIAKLYKQDTDTPFYLLQYINQFSGETFVKAAYLKLANHYLLQNNTEGYFTTLKKILTVGSETTDEDKAAQKEAEVAKAPNTILLKSRLLFDGGYYNESYTCLIKGNKEDFKTTKDQLEFIYRLARIEHKKENFDRAITHYELALKNGISYPYYFAANAALNLGLIYEEQGDKSNAKLYFEKCLKIKNHDYQLSIDQKAKAGLKRLEK